MNSTETPPYRDRLQRTATTTRDLLVHSQADRWEVFAKASFTREVELQTDSQLQVIHTEETGVAVRTYHVGNAGFAAASGLEAGASRRAIDGATAHAVSAPVDPLPPRRLLGSAATESPRPLPARGWAAHVAEELARALIKTSADRLRLVRTVIQEGAYSWILSTSEEFVAWFDGSTTSLLVEVVIGRGESGVWREWYHIPDPESFEPEITAHHVANRALLTLNRTTLASGLRDVILDGEVSAHLFAAMVPLFLATPADGDPLPELVDRNGLLATAGLSVADDRLDPVAPILGPCDGEGLPARRTLLVEDGVPRHRLASHRDALLYGEAPRGGATRLSYRDYPASGISNLKVLSALGLPPARLLAETGRALYLLRPLAPVELDLKRDSYRIVASGVWLEAGRVQGWQPVVELHGSLGLLLRRIDGVGADLAWYQTARGFVGAPTLLVRRQPVVG